MQATDAQVIEERDDRVGLVGRILAGLPTTDMHPDWETFIGPRGLRVPGRLHITWENDSTLKMDLDAGTQTRRFQFGAPAASAEPSWQGSSVARWQLPSGRGRGRGS